MAEKSGRYDNRRKLEPSVRPRGMRSHTVQVARRARLYVDGKTLVVRDQWLDERRYGVGSAGIRKAVFSPPAPDLWAAVTKRPAERWGLLTFQGEDGRAILEVPLAEWLPEAHAIGTLELRPAKCLDRTGLRALVSALGIPLEETPQSGAGESVQTAAPVRGAVRAVHKELPPWYSWVRGMGIFGWFTVLVVAFAAGVDWLSPVAAGALLLVPAADTAVRLGAWWRNRRDEATLLTEGTVITPHAVIDGRVTPRFIRTASVRVLPDDLVMTDTIGRERWLARASTYGVARMVRLIAADNRTPLGVEFRDANGEVRALLPWSDWFAGPQGEEQWTELVAALSVPVQDEKKQPSGRRAASAEPWWTGHPLAADARMMSPLPGKQARQETSWHRSVVGGNELLLVPLFSLVLVAGVFGSDFGSRIAGFLSILTIAAELVPAVVGSLISRLYQDKPFRNGQIQ